MEGIEKITNTPGTIIKEKLDSLNWTQEDLSQILDLSLKHTNELLKDKRPMSIEQATDISSALKLDEKEITILITALVYKYSQFKRNSEVREKAELFKLLPITEMIKRGWISKQKDVNGYLNSLKSVLGISAYSLSTLETELSKSVSNLSYRNVTISSDIDCTKRREDERVTNNNRIAWYLYVKEKANKIKNIPSYNKEKLMALFNELYSYTNTENTSEGIADFLKKLNSSGVRFLFVPHLSKTYTEGAAFDCENGPVIVLTGRTNKVDTFWFNMAHEIVHILEEHYKSDLVIDGEDELSKKTTDPREIKANEGATKALKGEEILKYFRPYVGYIPSDEVKFFSRKENIHPSIIVGKLAWEGKTSFATIHRYKDTIRDKIPSKYKIDELEYKS